MADGGNPAKKDNPRYEQLTGGFETQYYVAGRYFRLSPDEWNALPWWVTTTYMEGLKQEGIFGKDAANEARAPVSGTPLNTDLTGDLGTLPPGFKTRRAG